MNCILDDGIQPQCRTLQRAELIARVGTPTSASGDQRRAFTAAASQEPLAGIVGILPEERASSRIVGDTRSSIIDQPLTSVRESDLVCVRVTTLHDVLRRGRHVLVVPLAAWRA